MRHLGTRSGAFVFGSLALVLLTATAVWLGISPSARAGLQIGVNLIVNGDAELDVGSTDDNTAVTPTGWATTGNLSIYQYAWEFSPQPAPPAGGGSNFFGGNRPGATGTQATSVLAFATQIDGTPGLDATLSGLLGGWQEQADSGIVTVTFWGGTSETDVYALGELKIGPVTAADRNNESKFVSRSASCHVLPGTRSVVVEISTTSPYGWNDAYLDNLSLVLNPTTGTPAAACGTAPTTTTPPTTTPPTTTPPTTTPPTTTPPTTTPPTTTPPTTTPPNIDIDINVSVAPNITTSIATGAPYPSPAIPANPNLQYNPQTGQFFVRIQYRIRESELKRLCKRGCPSTVEIRSRAGRRLFGGLPGDGAVLGSRTGIRIKAMKRKLRIDIPINKARLRDLDFTTVGGFRVGETRTRIVLRTPAGDALTVRDGRIRISIARIESGALPGLQGIL